MLIKVAFVSRWLHPSAVLSLDQILDLLNEVHCSREGENEARRIFARRCDPESHKLVTPSNRLFEVYNQSNGLTRTGCPCRGIFLTRFHSRQLCAPRRTLLVSKRSMARLAGKVS